MNETAGNENNDPAIHSEILGGKRVSFISGWQHKEGNQVFREATAEYVSSAARLEHAVYLRPQLATEITDRNALLLDTVVDLDGQVDAVRIADYPLIHSLGPGGFSFELWLCARHIQDPRADSRHTGRPCAVFSKFSPDGQRGYSLLLHPDGRLDFMLTDRGALTGFSSAAGAVTGNTFVHVAVTGRPYDYLRFVIDGVENQRTGMLALPVTEGELILGEAPGSNIRRFSGQITALFVYSADRSSAQINSERFTRPRTAEALAGAWSLTSSARLALTCYFITDDFIPDGQPAPMHQTLPVVPALPAAMPPHPADVALTPVTAINDNGLEIAYGLTPADVPLTPVTVDDQLFLFRQTVDHQLIVNAYRLDGGALVPAHPPQVLAGLTCYRGWFTVVAHPGGSNTSVFTVFNCGANSATSTAADVISWRTFSLTGSNLSNMAGDGFSGMVSPQNISDNTGINFATHPTAVYQDGHIVLAMSTHEGARILALDFTVRADGALTTTSGDAAIGRNGENALEGGASRSVYIRELNPGARPYHPPDGYAQVEESPSGHGQIPEGALLRMENSNGGALCLSQWNDEGVLVETSMVAERGPDQTEPPQQFLWHLKSLSRSGPPQNGDAVSLAVFVGGAADYRFGRVRWNVTNPAEQREWQECRWERATMGSPAVAIDETIPVNNLNQVFGIYGVSENAVDESGQVELRESSVPFADNSRVILVPGVFRNQIMESATDLAGADLDPRGDPPARGELQVRGYGGLAHHGCAVVYLRRYIHPVAVYANHADAAGWFFARNRDKIDDDYNRQPRDNDYNNLPRFEFKRVALEALAEAPTNPPVKNDGTPEDSWYSFSFRLSSRFGGGTLTSGEEVLIETPNPYYVSGLSPWSEVVEYENQYDDALHPKEKLQDWNYWVFKVGEVVSGVPYSVVRGPILGGDPVVLLPRTPVMESRLARGAWPSEEDLAGRTAVEFVEPFVNHPLPGVPNVMNDTATPQRTARMLGIRPGLSGVLIGLARTLAVPALETHDANMRLTFRGNGDGLTLGNGLGRLHTGEGAEGLNNEDFYVEGGYLQGHMTAGLFYQIDLSRIGEDPGVWSNLQRRLVGRSLEFPAAPPHFIWTAPPPYKMAGVCEAVGALDFRNANGRPYVHAVMEAVLGRGTFGEGIFKPVLTIPIPEGPIREISEHVQARIVEEVNKVAPDPDKIDNPPRTPPPEMSWYWLSDLLALAALAREDDWKPCIDQDKLNRKTREVFSSPWMLDRISAFQKEIPVDPVKDIANTYASFGGVVGLIESLLGSEPFLDQLYEMRKRDKATVVQTQMHILTALDPLAASRLGERIMLGMTARLAQDHPAEILSKLSLDEFADVLKKVITTSFTVPDLPQSQTIHQALKLALGIPTSTQLSILIGKMDKYFNELPFRSGVLDWYVSMIGEGARIEILRDNIARNPQLFDQNRFQRENWRTVKAGLNVLATAGAIYSIVTTSKDWNDDTVDSLNIVATCIGSVGSMIETASFFGRQLLKLPGIRDLSGNRVMAAFGAVDADQRAVGRAARFAELLGSAKFVRFLEALGPIADVLLVAACAYRLANGGLTDWEKGMTGGNLALGAIGAVSGLLLFTTASAVAGPLSVFVFLAAVTLMGIDECHSREEERRIRERRKKIENWCNDLINLHDVRRPCTQH